MLKQVFITLLLLYLLNVEYAKLKQNLFYVPKGAYLNDIIS